MCTDSKLGQFYFLRQISTYSRTAHANKVFFIETLVWLRSGETFLYSWIHKNKKNVKNNDSEKKIFHIECTFICV